MVPQFTDCSFKEELNSFIFAKIKMNEHLTLSVIHEYAKENLDFLHCKTTLYKIIKSIGYSFKIVNRRKIIIETPRIVSLRIRFCRQYQLLKKENVTFVFLDETWVYQNGSQVRQWVLESHRQGIPRKFKNEGKRYTILSTGCEQGFLPGCDLILDTKINDRDYHKTMNGELFMKWIRNQLIPALHMLNSKCVIILDNAPYHSRKIEKPPTSSSRKHELQNWLSNQNIPFEPSFTKKQLWLLIKPHLTSDLTEYEVDEVLKAGHDVLRLPPYNCQYNPIELAWADCKSYYNKHIPSKLDSANRVKEVWQKALEQCTKEKWQDFIQHAEDEVKSDWHKYMGAYDIDNVPPFIINVNCDTSDFDSDFSDFEEPVSSNVRTDLESESSSSEEITIMVVDEESEEINS